jgi:hypothetical protein
LRGADDNVDRQEESIDRLEEKIDSDPSLSKVPDQRVQELQAEIKRGEKIIEGQEEQVEKEVGGNLQNRQAGRACRRPAHKRRKF